MGRDKTWPNARAGDTIFAPSCSSAVSVLVDKARGEALVGVPTKFHRDPADRLLTQRVVKCRRQNSVILGDVRLSDTGCRSHASTKTASESLNIPDDNFLTQKVVHPIWGNSILDLVVTEKPIAELKTGDTLGRSGHDLITLVMCKQNQVQTSNTSIRCFKRSSYRKLKAIMSQVTWEN